MKYVVINILSLVVIVISLLLWDLKSYPELHVEKGFGYLLQETSTVNNNIQHSDNTATTDLTAMSNIYNNLLKDGWALTQYDENSEFIEFIMEKDSDVVRARYDSNGFLTLISSPYEKSYSYWAYISEKEK